MKILITGHKGYIGSLMAPAFVTSGYDVVGFDSDLYRNCSFLPYQDISNWIHKDIRNATAADLKGFDTVIHLAGLSNDPLGDLDPELTYQINFRASVKLAKLAKESGVSRFIFASSCSNYGASDGTLLKETAPQNPVTPYAESKVLAEQEISKLASSSFSPVFMRMATVYGLSPKIRFDLVVNNLTAWACATGKVYLKSTGTSWRPLIHVRDVVSSYLEVVKAPVENVHNQVFNIGETEENYRVLDVANLVQKTVPNSKIEFAEDRHEDCRNYYVDFGKVKDVLPNFRCQWNVKSGIEELYQVFQTKLVSPEDFEGNKFKRVDHVRHLITTQKIDSHFYHQVKACN